MYLFQPQSTQTVWYLCSVVQVSTFRNRNLRMPDDCDLQGQVTAKYEDGVSHR